MIVWAQIVPPSAEVFYSVIGSLMILLVATVAVTTIAVNRKKLTEPKVSVNNGRSKQIEISKLSDVMVLRQNLESDLREIGEEMRNIEHKLVRDIEHRRTQIDRRMEILEDRLNGMSERLTQQIGELRGEMIARRER